MECPFIDREMVVDERINKPMNYSDFGGADYVFYDHDDGFGNVTRVQFCQLIGRKRDIFQCLNESEWRRCPHFLTMQERNDWMQAEVEAGNLKEAPPSSDKPITEEIPF